MRVQQVFFFFSFLLSSNTFFVHYLTYFILREQYAPQKYDIYYLGNSIGILPISFCSALPILLLKKSQWTLLGKSGLVERTYEVTLKYIPFL